MYFNNLAGETFLKFILKFDPPNFQDKTKIVVCEFQRNFKAGG